MSYSIKITIVDNPRNRIAAVEEATTTGAKVTQWQQGYTVTMDHSGHSGMIRFRSTNFENFTVVVGVHNYVRWCDIQPDLKNTATAAENLPHYYKGDRPEHQMLWKQSPTADVTTSNHNRIQLIYTCKEGHELTADLIYGDGSGTTGNIGPVKEDDGLEAEPYPQFN